jgi:hypothetical protein
MISNPTVARLSDAAGVAAFTVLDMRGLLAGYIQILCVFGRIVAGTAWVRRSFDGLRLESSGILPTRSSAFRRSTQVRNVCAGGSGSSP